MVCYKCLQETSPEESYHGLHPSCFLEWFSLVQLEDFKELIIRKNSSDSSPNPKFKKINTSFFQGRFKKYSTTLFGQSYILKVKEAKYPELPMVEFVSNQIAGALKIPVAPFYLLKFQNTVDTFVTKNFISEKENSNLIHIYRYIKEEEEFNCEALLGIIEKKTGKITAVTQFIHMCLFDALIGNHDRHGRNLGIIESPVGCDLAPLYDNPSYFGIEDDFLLGAEHSPRGKIATRETDEPSMKDYIIEFKNLGKQEEILDFYHRLDKANLSKLIEDSFLSEKRKHAFKKLINARMKELEDGII